MIKNKTFSLLLSNFLLIVLFMIGFHNIDTAINLKDGETDMTISGDIKDRSFIYRIGLMQIFAGFFSSVITSLFFLDRFINQ